MAPLTARNNDGERGIDRTDFPDEVFAFTVGQTHVNDHGIDATRNKLQFVQRFRRRNRVSTFRPASSKYSVAIN